jgi:hypothetical protein
MHSLMYAAYLAKSPSRQYDVAWAELIYTRSSAGGARGSVAFGRAGAIALFYDEQSPRAPAKLKKAYKLDAQFDGMPEPLARTARNELLSAFDVAVDGKMRPVVTAAFWSDRDGTIAGARPWARLVEDGAHLVAEELDKPEKALAVWAERYALSSEQAAIVGELFPTRGKVPPAAARVVVSAPQRTALGIIPNNPTRELLAGAGIVLE